MKKIAILIFGLSLSCVASAQVLNIHTTLPSDTPPNAYLKDMDNFQNQFEGTWIYQNGLEYLEVRFLKKERMLFNPGPNQYYEDNLLGEYKYINSNGVEKVNSLNNLNQNHTSAFDYNLHSITKLSLSNAPLCPVCPAGTERMYMFFNEPANDDAMLWAKFVMRRVIENGVEKIKVQFVTDSSASGRKKGDFTAPSTFTNFSLPYGDYTLVKQ
jgi:hypothetical protein